jgi:hypothetical protein
MAFSPSKLIIKKTQRAKLGKGERGGEGGAAGLSEGRGGQR